MKAFDEIYYIDSRKPEAEDILALRLSQLLARYPLPPVYLCIGSDRVTGDSLGPPGGNPAFKGPADASRDRYSDGPCSCAESETYAIFSLRKISWPSHRGH